MDIRDVKTLREQTGMSVSKCKEALEEADGDIEKAHGILREKAGNTAAKKADRETHEGIVASYVHPDGKTGALIELLCETDFVAKNEDFQQLAHELCLQIAAMDPQYIHPEEAPEGEESSALLHQPWIKDQSRVVTDVIEEYIALMGENIRINRFTRYAIN